MNLNGQISHLKLTSLAYKSVSVHSHEPPYFIRLFMWLYRMIVNVQFRCFFLARVTVLDKTIDGFLVQAARNCLINEHNVVKVSDFGMTRYETQYVNVLRKHFHLSTALSIPFSLPVLLLQVCSG